MPDLLPPNATPQERALSLATDRLPGVPIRTLWSPMTCPAAQLPWLAWALSVDQWDATWPDETKRQIIAASIEQHRQKGTVAAVRRALQRLGYEVEIDEKTGVAYTFRLRCKIREGDTAGGAVVEAALNRAVQIALQQKPVRSALLNTAFVAETGPAFVYSGGVTMSGISYDSKQETNFVPAPTGIGYEQTGAGLVSFTWTGAGEYFEIEVRNIADDSVVLSTLSFTNTITDLSVQAGQFYVYVRAAAGGLFSGWVRRTFDIIVYPPYDVVFTNENQPARSLLTFKSIESGWEGQICPAGDGWQDPYWQAQLAGGSATGPAPWTGGWSNGALYSGLWDYRVRSIGNGGVSAWVEVLNCEVLPWPETNP